MKTLPTSSNKNDILNFILQTHFVENYIKKLERTEYKTIGLIDDEIQEIYLLLCGVNQETWDTIYNQSPNNILSFVSGVISRQINSNTSTLYRKLKRYQEKELLFDNDIWAIASDTNKIINFDIEM